MTVGAAAPIPFPPIEPPNTPWQLARVRAEAGEDLVALGADLEPGTLLAAYRCGLFPMGVGPHGKGPIGWWSPDPRGVLWPQEFRLRKSLKKVLPRFEVRVDTAFAEVVAACASPEREGRWITPATARAYTELHRLGWAHSVETWQDGALVGGLYGVAIGGLFAGESMFHTVRDASKVALHGLVGLLAADADPRRLIDVQWRTDHLARLGVGHCSRADYLAALTTSLAAPHLDFRGR